MTSELKKRTVSAQEGASATTPPVATTPKTAAAGNVEYEDCYLKLDSEGVTVKRYYFPFTNSKFIPYARLTRYETGNSANLSWYDFKGWGMGISNIWWAIGMGHSQVFANDLSKVIIFSSEGSGIRSGTCMENPQRVLEILASKASHANPYAFH